MKTMHSINQINNGAVFYYSGFKIETVLDYNKLCELVNEKIDAIFLEYSNRERVRLQNCINDAIGEAHLQGYLKLKEYDELRYKESDWLKVIDRSTPHAKSIEITPTEKGIKFSVVTDIDEYFDMCKKHRDGDFAYNENVYGKAYVDAYAQFVLPPFEVELVTGEKKLLESTLLLFRNKTAIIRTELPLKDVNTTPLFEGAIDDYIVSVSNPCALPIEPQSNTLAAINTCYYLFLFTMKKVSAVLGFAEIKNLVITEHSAKFKHIEKASNQVREDIYRIITAPVPEWKGILLNKEVEELFSQKCYALSGINYILNNMNMCLSIADGYLVEEASGKYGQEYISKNFIGDIRNGAEFALCTILLKCVNNRYSFYKRTTKPHETERFRKEYNENVIFIDDLQSQAWGSAREQVEAFERMMAYFLDSKNVKEKTEALNVIFEGERNMKIVSLQNMLSIMGIAVTLIFGLPATCETVKIINEFLFASIQIPEELITRYSLIIWLLLLLLLIAFVILKSKFSFNKVRQIRHRVASFFKAIGKKF